MANGQKFRFTVLLMISEICVLSAISGGFIMHFTNHDELGRSLFVGTAILFFLLMTIAGCLGVSEKKRFRQTGNVPYENTVRGKRPSTEVEKFHRSQKEMNLEEWNTNDFTEPPAIS